jgi:ArsR family transcriptional regulator, arsenate/arsenite/antimonite-responsive transcriptional repressor
VKPCGWSWRAGSSDPVDRQDKWYYISLDIEMEKPLSSTVHALKALAHPGRLRILAMLRRGELCVCQMTAVLDLAASTVSAHLADLKRVGLVGERKDGRWVFHRLDEGEAAAALLEPVWRAIAGDPQVEADARLLRDLRRVSVEDLCRVDLDLKRLGIKRPPAVEPRARQ